MLACEPGSADPARLLAGFARRSRTLGASSGRTVYDEAAGGYSPNSHLARPTFYERLRRIERILGTDLGSAESRTSLHVALLALEAARVSSAQTG